MFKHYAEYAKEKKVAIPDYLLPNSGTPAGREL